MFDEDVRTEHFWSGGSRVAGIDVINDVSHTLVDLINGESVP